VYTVHSLISEPLVHVFFKCIKYTQWLSVSCTLIIKCIIYTQWGIRLCFNVFKGLHPPRVLLRNVYGVGSCTLHTVHDPLSHNNSDTNTIHITTTPIPPYFICLSWWQKTSVKNTRMCPYTYSTHVYITQV
jgi:hypothetical protein